MDIKPLTALIGPNGSGKSSILQALSIMKRFVTMPSTLSLENPGNYEELVHKHDPSFISARSSRLNGFGRKAKGLL
jgi:AAA15 family ATPase/GTPase